MIKKQFRLYFLAVLMLLLLPAAALAQSTIIPTPTFPDISASLKSSSNNLSVILMFLALLATLAKPGVSLALSLPFLFISKKKNKWGKVINSINGQPVANVIVNLYKIKGNKQYLVSKTKSSDQGDYGFDVGRGEYKISINSSCYSYPSKIIADNDYSASNPLSKKIIVTNYINNPQIDIFIDPVFTIEPPLVAKLDYYGKRAGIPLLLLGTFFALYSLYYFPSISQLIIAGIYAIIWLSVAITAFFSYQGLRVVSKKTGLPINLTQIKIIDKSGKIKTYITNELGEIKPKLYPGEYQLEVSRPGYNSLKAKIKLKNPKGLEQILIKI